MNWRYFLRTIANFWSSLGTRTQIQLNMSPSLCSYNCRYQGIEVLFSSLLEVTGSECPPQYTTFRIFGRVWLPQLCTWNIKDLCSWMAKIFCLFAECQNYPAPKVIFIYIEISALVNFHLQKLTGNIHWTFWVSVDQLYDVKHYILTCEMSLICPGNLTG